MAFLNRETFETAAEIVLVTRGKSGALASLIPSVNEYERLLYPPCLSVTIANRLEAEHLRQVDIEHHVDEPLSMTSRGWTGPVVQLLS